MGRAGFLLLCASVACKKDAISDDADHDGIPADKDCDDDDADVGLPGTWFADADGDACGDPLVSEQACDPPPPVTSQTPPTAMTVTPP